MLITVDDYFSKTNAKREKTGYNAGRGKAEEICRQMWMANFNWFLRWYATTMKIYL